MISSDRDPPHPGRLLPISQARSCPVCRDVRVWGSLDPVGAEVPRVVKKVNLSFAPHISLARDTSRSSKTESTCYYPPLSSTAQFHRTRSESTR